MTEEKKEKKSIEDFKWLLRLGAIIFLLCAFGVSAASAYQKMHEEKIYTNLKLGKLELSKKTIDQAGRAIDKEFSKVYDKGFYFIFGDKKINIPNKYEVILGVERELVEIDAEKTAEKAFWIGRSGNVFSDFKDQLFMLFRAKKVQLAYDIDEKTLKRTLMKSFSKFEDKAQPARLDIEIISENEKKVKIKVIDEKEGVAFDYDKAIAQLREKIENFENKTITLKLETDIPSIKKSQTEQAVTKADEIINTKEKLKFVFEDKTWEAEWSEYVDWLCFDKKDNEVVLTFDQEKFFVFLDKVSKDVNVPAKNARFELKKGRVEEFQVSENGRKINKQKTYKNLVENFFNFNSNEIELVVEEALPEVTSDNINDMGIKELIGKGESDFSGSPANRRHNIRNGSDTLHGLLIEPGEEFSLVQTLGRIDATTGYLPELVIRGNKTIPEYGGGLCQVATTMFRVAINAGLPVTERKPHSYRVSYYEPAGMDATIYDPRPDLKFINDTENYILIQTHISGNILTYEFWGTDDGRKVEVTQPKIFNITYPGPTKEIVSPDLEPGQRRCTESAHRGADAVFYRTITYASGEKKEETWASTYRPWQAVCLVGPSAESQGDDDSAPKNSE